MSKFLIFVVLAILAFLVMRKIQEPKAGTERLAITVWAAFGPYGTAKEAEDALHRVKRVVFTEEGIAEHEEWIKGHIENFYKWEKEGKFEKGQKIMRGGLGLTSHGRAFQEACQKVKIAALADAQKQLNGLSESLPDVAEMIQPTLDYHRKRLSKDEEQE